MDPILYQVVRAKALGIVREMQNSLFRTGYSTVIRESQDASCALLDAEGQIVAQHLTLPGHMGVFPASCRAVLDKYGDSISAGDAYLINHPYLGGSGHAPDFAVFTPFVSQTGELLGFCASMAHKSDIGGPAPGSCWGGARDIFSEGLHLPPVAIERDHSEVGELFDVIAANSRAPQLVLGDLRGQVGACRLGERRLAELENAHGADAIREFESETQLATFRRLSAGIQQLGDGQASARRSIDTEAGDIVIKVTATKSQEGLVFNFSESDNQLALPANIRPPLVAMGCAYALVALLDPEVDINSGVYQAFRIETRRGSVVDPEYPHPVNTYNPTVHAVIDAVLETLTSLADSAGRADGCASRSIVVGGVDSSGRSYVQYEIFGGGAGAHAEADGASGTTVNHTNGRIASIEIVETEFPVRLTRFELITDSGGAGKHRGGLGFRREYLFLAEGSLSLRSTRHHVPPRGIRGGEDGLGGKAVLNPGTEKEREVSPRETGISVRRGDVFRIDTPGGGGYGEATDRPRDAVLTDLAEGYISRSRALATYGWESEVL